MKTGCALWVVRIALCILSSILLISSFPNFNLEFLAWFALVPWLVGIKDLKPRQAFLYSYLVGILFFAGSMWWLSYVSVLGLILLTLYLALFFGLFGLFTVHPSTSLGTGCSLFTVILLPAIWVSLEYLRSTLFGGFGWNALGYSQYLSLPIIQIADITGVYGVSFLIVMVNVVLAELRGCQWFSGLIVGELRRDLVAKRQSIVAILLLLASIIYGHYKLHLPPTTYHLPVKISIIQGNIPQEQKWDEAYRYKILDAYEILTVNAAEERPDLIIWPETSLPGYIDEEFINERVRTLVQKINIPLLAGAATSDGGHTFNSAVLFSLKAEMLAKYDKLHLVPFGEYIPFEKHLPFLRDFISKPVGDFVAGKDYTIFSLFAVHRSLSTKFGVLICFEDIFPGLLRQFVKRGAEFMVNITNDAWFGKTSAPNQHAQASVFRAVENRLPVVRSANTGLSCFIDKYGRIFDKVTDGKVDIFISGYKTAKIAISPIPSFYTRYGDIFAFLCIGLLFLTLGVVFAGIHL